MPAAADNRIATTTSMNLADIFAADCVRVPLRAADKQSAVYELVDLLAERGRIDDARTLKDAVWSRELVRTTGIGHGLAIPHGKCAGIPRLAMAVGKPATPMEFGSIDQKPVRLIVLLASPVDRTADHIQALAKISKLMTVEDTRNRVYAAATAQEIFDLLTAPENRT